MNFLNPEFFYLTVLAIIGLIVLWGFAAKKRRIYRQNLLGSDADNPRIILLSQTRRQVRYALLIAVVLLLGAAIARPWWGSTATSLSGKGRDVLILFDTSKSMLATDVAPSRLKHGQYLMKQLVAALPGDRFAIVPFAGAAILQCPFTTDYLSVNHFLNDLNVETIPQGGTNLAQAIAVAQKAFKSADTNFRAIVMVTDGEELTGRTEAAVKTLQEQHIALFIVGLGDANNGSPIPLAERGTHRFVRDAQGKVVYSKLNRKLLERLAAETGGLFIQSDAGNTGLATLVGAVKKLEKTDTNAGQSSVPIERFMYFLSCALALLMLYLLLSEYRALAVYLVLLGSMGVADLQAATPENDRAAEAKSGEVLPQDKAKFQSDSPVALYNYALQSQKQGELTQALEYYEQALAIAPENSPLSARILHNLAVLKHTELQNQLSAITKADQIPTAEKSVKQAEQALRGTTELYSQSASLQPVFDPIFTNNLRRLNLDREELARLKKQLEELKKQQQQAQKSLEQAQKDNQQQAQKNQSQNQSQQDQNAENDAQKSPASGNSPQQNQQQSAPGDSLKQAQQDLQKLQQQAQQLPQQSLNEQSRSAGKNVEQAQQQQAQGDYAQAGQNLQAALEQIKNAGDNAQQNQQSGQVAPNSENAETPKPEPNNEQQAATSETPANATVPPDRQSAENLLDVMARDEQNTRDYLQQKRNELRRLPMVEKDW